VKSSRWQSTGPTNCWRCRRARCWRRASWRAADIVAALAAFGDAQLEIFIEGWYSADTQAALAAVMKRLGK
jgi:hypothetical protein